MLVLSRRVGEQIVIDDHICLTVVEIKGNRVRLGIAAPEEVRIERLEVRERRLELASELLDPIII
jgi:carbon storage regulator